MDTSDISQQSPTTEPNPIEQPTEQAPKNWRQNKVNKVLLFIVVSTVILYVATFTVGLVLNLNDPTGISGLAALPLLFLAWALTPFALISLIVLTIRTKNIVFILMSTLIALGIVGYFIYFFYAINA